MHRCKDCAVQFDKATAYFLHRRKKHPKFLCPECGKVFGLRKKLRYHLRSCPYRRRLKRSIGMQKKVLEQSGSIIRFSDYKRLPIVTAKELDSEFEIYMDRKFGKKGFFRNEKMCKFCSTTFVLASDFADHVRNHYKSIPLDATGVKSKFDFMQFMGLKIRETNDTDCSDTDAFSKAKHEITECKVVIVGERCNICLESFKCLTDLRKHNEIFHWQKKRNEIMLVLKIGNEIISKIPLKKRYVTNRDSKTVNRSNINGNDNRDSARHRSKSKDTTDKEMRASCTDRRHQHHSNNKTHYVDEFIGGGNKNKQSAITWEKTQSSLRSQNEKCNGDSNVTPWIQPAVEKDFASEMLSRFSSYKDGYRSTEVGVDTELMESPQIYADELYERMQSCESWKNEMSDVNRTWYSDMKLEEDCIADDDDCYCIGPVDPRLLPKEERSAWEQEHYDNMLNQDAENCHDLSFHESPPIYKYSCDSKYQADFSFPSEERSYGLQIKTADNQETNNNEIETNNNHNVQPKSRRIYDYKGSITIKNEPKNLNLNLSPSVIHKYVDESFDFHELADSQAAAVTASIKNYPESIIKEEVMLEDCTCYIDDVYSTLSH